ncbi:MULTISPECIES: hypothetical protein [Streptomyces]|uniref:hypothetical protein n=1 Tax=Streptomyces TaxID=1883 RepID=UPI00163C18AE|nr:MULTISPECIES: hypothetical protein [Streptomyces]MBC2878576.1 hypothetical protein [Streptomyces sp. TYQ1024]UBI35234.1 hypothetical protein K7I03_01350 [Streptomyces mobaraensis]UKW27825.1 hypothetical protein MCU78_01385 [Streptomyces sp. TYQ1024]
MAAAAAPLTDPCTLETLPKKRLPAGHPREWYESHNRRLKAMRLAIALLHSGAYRPEQATNRRIRRVADRIGVRPPSNATCRMVRSLIHAEAPAARAARR